MREVEDVVTRSRKRIASDALPALEFKPEHVALINRAMHGVTQEGTSTRVFAGAPYKSGGKTGTAQAVGVKANEKYNASKLEEHKRDHSLYTAFAPVDAPVIALAVVVENAGFGSEAAAPIARRVMDFVMADRYPNEADLALTRVGKSSAPVGPPRLASSVPLPGSISVAGTAGVTPQEPAASAAVPAAAASAALPAAARVARVGAGAAAR